MKGLAMAAGWLLVLGGLVMGLQGLMGYNLLDSLLGSGSMLTRVVNLAIGLSALYLGYNMLMGKGKK